MTDTDPTPDEPDYVGGAITEGAPKQWPPFDGPVLEAEGVVAGYVPEVNILNGCSLTLADRELVGIIGPNGAGKSTLLKSLFGLIPIREGTVTFLGESVVGVKANQLVARGIGYVPQNNNVFPHAHRRGEPRDGPLPRPQALRASAWKSCASCSRCSGSAASSGPARCRAVSARWWRWAGR